MIRQDAEGRVAEAVDIVKNSLLEKYGITSL